MKSKKSYYLLCFLVLSVIAITLFIIFSIYLTRDRGRPIKIYKDHEIVEQVKVDFNNFNPGDEKMYTLQFEGVYDGKYSLDFDFVETKPGEIKNYLDVGIKMNGEEICDCPLLELLSGKRNINLELLILEKEIVEFEIIYIMPEEVGNEAENSDGKFNIIISVKETEVV